MGKRNADQSQAKKAKPKTQNNKAAQNHNQTIPSISVVFPLYGCETGEKMNYQNDKGLNSLRKAKCIWTWAAARDGQPNVASVCGQGYGRPCHCGVWHLACVSILRSAMSKVGSDNDTCPVSH